MEQAIMSKVIQVLEKMASDATLINEDNITSLLAEADISVEQQQAIEVNNTEQLIEATDYISKIKFFIPIAVADEDEEQSNTVANKLLIFNQQGKLV